MNKNPSPNSKVEREGWSKKERNTSKGKGKATGEQDRGGMSRKASKTDKREERKGTHRKELGSSLGEAGKSVLERRHTRGRRHSRHPRGGRGKERKEGKQ